jgi:hypothetical protein
MSWYWMKYLLGCEIQLMVLIRSISTVPVVITSPIFVDELAGLALPLIFWAHPPLPTFDEIFVFS